MKRMRLVPITQVDSKAPDVQAMILIRKLMQQKRSFDNPASDYSQTSFPLQTTGVQTDAFTNTNEPKHPAQDDPLTMRLLERYLKHINHVKEYLEHAKGYEWDENLKVIGNDKINIIQEAEKQIANYLRGNDADLSFISPGESYMYSPPETRLRKRKKPPSPVTKTVTPTQMGHQLKTRRRIQDEKYVKRFDKYTRFDTPFQ